MKRLLSILFPLLALLLLTACGRKEPAEVPAPTPQAAYPTAVPASAAPSEAPDEAPPEAPVEVPPDNGELPLIVDPGYPEGSFPGGLDDDGPEPLEPIDIDAETQYEANLFLSNFVEQGFANYYYGEDFANRASDFAHTWYKVNDYSAIEYGKADGDVCEILTLDQVNAVVSRYFPFTIDEWSAEHLYTPSDHAFYRDGRFFFPAADGEAYNRVAVVTHMDRREDGSILMDFAVYELDIAAYFDLDGGIPRSYYELTADEAERTPTLTLAGGGLANALLREDDGRPAYQLVEYIVWDAPESG